MILTISGVPGSGKTSVAKILAERLKMPFYSIGGLRGKMAEERGISIDELNKIGEKDPMTDTTVDEYQRKLGETSDNFVIEGRLSWHFIPKSFKIFLSCDPDESAKRIFSSRKAGERPDEQAYATWEEARRELDERTASDVRRYGSIYGLDYRNPSNYDLIVDTTKKTGPEDTAETILQELKTRGMLN